MQIILDYNEPELLPNRQRAERGARLLNFVLDTIIAAIIGSTIAVGTMIVLNNERFDNFDLILFFCGYFGYYILMEYNFSGKTIAKMLTKTCVLQNTGEPITFAQAFERTFVRLVPFEPFSIFLNDKNLCWHDTATNTVVVMD